MGDVLSMDRFIAKHFERQMGLRRPLVVPLSPEEIAALDREMLASAYLRSPRRAGKMTIIRDVLARILRQER